MTFTKPSFERGDQMNPKHQGHNCAAYGCPLPASVGSFDSIRHCSYHAGRKPGENDQITTAIKTNLWMFEALHRLTTPELYYVGTKETSTFQIAHIDVKEIVKRNGRNDLLPQKLKNRHGVMMDEETNDRAWSARIFEAFNIEINKVSKAITEKTREEAQKRQASAISEFAARLAA